MNATERIGVAIAASVLVLLWGVSGACAGARRTRPPGTAGDGGGTEPRLVAAKTTLMSADYRGDLVELARLRDEVSKLDGDPRLGYLAHYWAGFASWREAINGASANVSQADLQAHLESAAEDFAAAARLRDNFADAYAAGSMVHGWLVAFTAAADKAVARQHLESAKQLGERAKALAPGNPRVLWMEAANFMYLPPAMGGDKRRAITIYRQMAAASEGAAAPTSPLPDWGKPEALMSLAYAHLNLDPPELKAAEAEAREALRLVPEWHYVRDILLPTIEKRAAAAP